MNDTTILACIKIISHTVLWIFIFKCTTMVVCTLLTTRKMR